MGAVWTLLARLDVIVGPDIVPWFSPTVVTLVWSEPRILALGLAYSVPLLGILLCHELGHYLMCRRYGVSSSLPYFIPLPAVIGTLGAFIRIRSLLPDKRKLFDVAIAGPLAGFAALLPVLWWGLAHSPPMPIGDIGGVATVPGQSLGLWVVSRTIHGPLPPGTMLNLHPFVLAAWFGMFATAYNLIPVSQLDGGHILYAVLGPKHRRVARSLWLVLAMAGLFWPGWLVLAVLVRLLGLEHPPVRDESIRLDRKRKILVGVAIAMLLFCLMPIPQREIALLPTGAVDQTPIPFRELARSLR